MSLATFKVNCLLVEPILVEPLYVVTVRVPTPLVAFGICLPNSLLGVQLADVVALVEIFPLVLPNEYATVCVKFDTYGLIVIDLLEPIVNEPLKLNGDTRLIVGSVIV